MKYYIKNRERLKIEGRERNKKKRKHERDVVIEAYGGKCICCGESIKEFLNLDHKNNDGNIERKKFGSAGQYKRAIKECFPKKYQLLCFNCNLAKSIYKTCPHQIKIK